jgi:hypothetical protein
MDRNPQEWTGIRRNGQEWTGIPAIIHRNGPESTGMDWNPQEWTGIHRNRRGIDRNYSGRSLF